MSTTTVALVTGANKGIGYEIAKGLIERGITVVVGARDPGRGKRAAESLGEGASHVHLDVTDAASASDAATTIAGTFGRLDILVNNAAVLLESGEAPSSMPLDKLRATYEANVFGVVSVTNAMLPLLRRSPAGRIVNLSSGLGSLEFNSPGGIYHTSPLLAYSSSKTALNAVTVLYANELADTPIKVNGADPGYCATDLNHHSGPRTAAQGAIAAVRLATLPADGPTGRVFDEDGPVPW